MKNVFVCYIDSIRYSEAWSLQTSLHEMTKAVKLINRKAAKKIPSLQFLILCQHPPVYTLGTSGKMDNLLLSENELQQRGIEFFKINRGGDITFHGPQQLVGYPILDMDYFFTDIHKYVRYLEQAIINTLEEYGIAAYREKGYTGVWIPASERQKKRKICAIGIHLSRWVTLHGFAFNINTDLDYFKNIIPCGIEEEDKTVTSLAQELGKPIDFKEVTEKVLVHLGKLFEFSVEQVDLNELKNVVADYVERYRIPKS